MKPITLTLSALTLLIVTLYVPNAGAEERPNIVWLLSEDNSVHYPVSYTHLTLPTSG